MLNTLLSSTKFVSFESMSGGDLSTAVSYLSPKARRIALVRDSRPSALVDELASRLRERYELLILDRVQPNPLASDVSAMAASLGNIDLVIGLGGGSVMDSAKALAMLAENGGKLEDYLGPDPVRKIERKGRPLILVPTTAGTGSEATRVGVFTAPSGRKYTLGSPLFQADAALLSGQLAASMPPSLTAATGFDALSHALESIWNKNATPVTIEAATRAAVMVINTLPAAYKASLSVPDGTSMESRNLLALHMLEAASAAGMAFSITGTALVHALSFVLSEEWHVPHGTACAFTLEDAYRLQSRDPEIAARLIRLGKDVLPEGAFDGVEVSDRLLNLILDMKRSMGLPFTFTDLGVTICKADIVGVFERAFDDPKMANSLPPARREDVFAFLEAKA